MTGEFRVLPARMAAMKLSGSEFRVMMAVNAHDRFSANGRGCYAGPTALANETNMHPKMVAKALRKLVDQGLLTVAKNGKYNEYRVVMDGSEFVPNGSKSVPDGEQIRSPDGSEFVPQKERRKESMKESKESNPAKRAVADAPAVPKVELDGDVFFRERFNELRRQARREGLDESTIESCVAAGKWEANERSGDWQEYAGYRLEEWGVSIPGEDDQHPEADRPVGKQDDGATTETETTVERPDPWRIPEFLDRRKDRKETICTTAS